MIDLKQLLVPVDFSRSSNNALRYACALAKKFSAEVHLLHVTDPIKGTGYLPPPEEWLDEMQREAQEQLAKLPEASLAEGLKVSRDIRSGFPFSEIIHYARANGVDLIVMGTHGRSGLAHVLLGSVAERVVRKAPCPVLTVRDPKQEFVMV